jgi:plasmid stabilization system protein ParE
MVTPYEVEYLPTADNDLENIANVLSDFPEMLARIFKEMDEKLLLLRDHPRMYPVYQYRKKYRKMVLEEYLLFYTIDDAARKITVCRVIYEKMNLKKIIK